MISLAYSTQIQINLFYPFYRTQLPQSSNRIIKPFKNGFSVSVEISRRYRHAFVCNMQTFSCKKRQNAVQHDQWETLNTPIDHIWSKTIFTRTEPIPKQKNMIFFFGFSFFWKNHITMAYEWGAGAAVVMVESWHVIWAFQTHSILC